MDARPHWSYSSINQYLRCPLQWFFQRVVEIPVRTSGSGQVLGSAVHAALATYHRSIQANDAVSSDKVVDALVQTWKERESEKCVVYRDGETRDDCVAQGVSLIEVYLREPTAERIVAVEREMIVPLQNSHGEYLEKPLVAISDLITEHDAGLTVTELKTGSRAYSEADVKTSLQPLCYVHAVTETFCKPVDVEFAILVKTKTPKIQRCRAPQTRAEVGRLGDIVQAIERAITAGAFYPVESALNCSTCPFRSPCREWSRKSVNPAPASSTDVPEAESVCSSN